MPKIKTCKGAAKRFKLTKKGKVKFKKAYKSHILEHKSPKMKRQARKNSYIHAADVKNVKQMLPYA
jgi:large subunit ribosomal protein L35